MPQFQGIFRQPRQQTKEKLEEVQTNSQGRKNKKRVTFRKKLMYMGDQPSGTFTEVIASVPSTSDGVRQDSKNANSAFRRVVKEGRLDECTLKLDDDIIKRLDKDKRPKVKSGVKPEKAKGEEIECDANLASKLFRKVTEINIEYENDDVICNYTKQTIEKEKKIPESAIESISSTYDDTKDEYNGRGDAMITSYIKNANSNINEEQSDVESKSSIIINNQELEISCLDFRRFEESEVFQREPTDRTALKSIQLKQENYPNSKTVKKEPQTHVLLSSDKIENSQSDIYNDGRQTNESEAKGTAQSSLYLLPRSVCSQTEDVKYNRQNISRLNRTEIGVNVTAEQNVHTSQTEVLHVPKSTSCTHKPTPSEKRTSVTQVRSSIGLLKTKETQAARRSTSLHSAAMQTDKLCKDVIVAANPRPTMSDKCVQKREVLLVRSTDMKDKGTQMYEYLTESEFYCIEWIHNNLFEVFLNPYHLIPDERSRTASEITNYTSENQWLV